MISERGRTLEPRRALAAAESVDGVASASSGELVHDLVAGPLLLRTAWTQAFLAFRPQWKVGAPHVELKLERVRVLLVIAIDDEPRAARSGFWYRCRATPSSPE